MEKSFLNFKEKFPEWTPGPSGTMYLSRLLDFGAKTLKKQPARQLPPLGSYAKPKNPQSGLSVTSPIRNIGLSILAGSESAPFTPEDEYKLRITSSSSSDDQCDEGDHLDMNSTSAGFGVNLAKSRSRGKRLVSSNKNQANSESLLDLVNKYVDNQSQV